MFAPLERFDHTDGVDHLHEGSALDGRFRLLELVGVDGRGEVWRAVDEFSEREVAVRMLTADTLADPEARIRFHQEARAAARLSHPAIAAIHECGELGLEDGAVAPYVVTDYVRGQTLEERLRSGPLSSRETLQVAVAVAGALACAHRGGVVHRDIRPANIMLTPDGVKVIGFGTTALSAGPADAQPPGPLTYLAPELLDEAGASPAADVYALGVILMACQTGPAAPSGGAPAPPTNDLPAGLAELWASCLGVNPRDRPSAARLVTLSRRALRSTAPDGGRSAVHRGLERRLGAVLSPPHRLRWLLTGAGLVAAVVAVAILVIPGPARPSEGETALGATGHPGTTTKATPRSTAPNPPNGDVQTAPGATRLSHTTSDATSQVSSPSPPLSSSQSLPSPLEIIDRLTRAIQDGVASGQIRRDVGTDLHNLIAPVASDLAAGRHADVLSLAGALRSKIATRSAEGTVTPAAATTLDALVGSLTASAGR